MIQPVERWNGGTLRSLRSHQGEAVERSPSTEDAKLRRTAMQLEGLFVQRMFAAMRETVPQDGIVEKSAGESTFSALLDEKFAEQVPAQWTGEHSLAEALYRQLRLRIEPTVAEANVEMTDASTVPRFHRSTPK